MHLCYIYFINLNHYFIFMNLIFLKKEIKLSLGKKNEKENLSITIS
jgi:hypothetical protein